jgi:hypothetical protein
VDVEVNKEPQGVAELMAHTEAAWQRQLDACADATIEMRAALVADLAALRAEYGDADYPRKAAIEKELRALIRRHDALGIDAEAPAPEPAVEAPPPEPPPPPPPPPPMPDQVEAPAEPHGAVPLGPESSVRPRNAEPGPPESHGPVPLGPESAVRPGEAPRPAPPPPRARATHGGAAGPIPHGAPGPGSGFASRSDGPEREAEGDDRPEADDLWHDSPGGGWTRAFGALDRWVARGRLAYRRELLLRKREARLAELGVRIRQLEERGIVAAAGDDAGVRARLAQVAQVDAELTRVQARRESLGRD